MLTIDRRSDGILAIYADGQLTTDDYADFVPRFETLAQGGPTPMRIELGPAFTGWSVPALWRDLKFDYRHRGQFGRTAIIGDKRWEKWRTELTDPFFAGAVRFFDLSRSDEAEQWLRGAGQ